MSKVFQKSSKVPRQINQVLFHSKMFQKELEGNYVKLCEASNTSGSLGEK